jgi:phospholipase/carboxylesterase
MVYQIDLQMNFAKLFQEPHSRMRVPYHTVKEMREFYPNDNFAVIGEIGGITRPPGEGDLLMLGSSITVPIQPRGSLKKPFEWVSGYIAVGRNTYIGAVRGLFPSFLKTYYKEDKK